MPPAAPPLARSGPRDPALDRVLPGTPRSGTGRTDARGTRRACPAEVIDVVVWVGQWGHSSRAVRRLRQRDDDRGLGRASTRTTSSPLRATWPHSTTPISSCVNGAHYDGWAGPRSRPWTRDRSSSAPPRNRGRSSTGGAGGSAPLVRPRVATGTSTASPRPWRTSPDAEDLLRPTGDGLGCADLEPLPATLDRRSSGLRPGAHLRGHRDRVRPHGRGASASPTQPRGLPARGRQRERARAPATSPPSRRALTDGTVDVLVYNTQTSGGIPEQLRAAAEDAGVPVVEVTESPADADVSFVEWQSAQLSALSDALSRTP